MLIRVAQKSKSEVKVRGIKIGDSKVLESRETADGMIRRRRISSDGKHRFTTYERIELPPIMVRKRSGNKEEFDRDKLIASVRRSVGKFFSSSLEVEQVVDQVTERIYELGVEEVTSRQIGQITLDVLAEVNEVAYVRFASVFQEFTTLSEFEQIIKEQKEKKAAGKLRG
ncbi:transcriptional repressor NrdR [Candidatus Saccharibacteria bacterium]|nr:transcriptional repressor NrdR [Candidatus Saccharibacteria bacterium]MBR2989659.1 transcriptional repressor NrdR [Candidatus Saccharibacteria bacterium]